VNGQTLTDLERKYAPEKGKLAAVRSPLERWRQNRWNEGGDKMSPERHGYADDYARLLSRWTAPTVVEVGIFQGVSLAVWCDLFPDGTVIGLDLDLSRFFDHRHFLAEQGAFSHNFPMVVGDWDAYAPNVQVLKQVLRGRTIDVLVDDGPHTDMAVLTVLDVMLPLLSPQFTYIVEDMPNGAELIRSRIPSGDAGQSGLLGWVET
jgi:hypothetical protein